MDMNRNKIKVIAGIVIVFLLGALIGSLGTGIYFKHRIRRFVKSGRPFPIKHFFMKRISELDLNQSQQAEIEEIVNKLQAELFEFKKKSKPEAKKIVKRNISLIKEKLNSEQKQKLDNLLNEFHEKRKAEKRRRHKRMTPDQIMSALKKELNLTLEQETRVRPIIQDHVTERRAIFEKYKGEGLQDRRDEMKKNRQNTEKRLEKILTEEQTDGLRKFWKERRKPRHKP